MTRVSSFGSVGFVLVCLHLLPVTSHTMTPSPTHIGFSGSLPVQEIQGNPAHSVLFVHIDKVLHWACAVILRNRPRQLGTFQDQALEATGTKTPSIDLRNVPKSSAYQTFKSCHQINLRPSNQTSITSAERVKDIPAKSSIAVHHVHSPFPRE